MNEKRIDFNSELDFDFFFFSTSNKFSNTNQLDSEGKGVAEKKIEKEIVSTYTEKNKGQSCEWEMGEESVVQVEKRRGIDEFSRKISKKN